MDCIFCKLIAGELPGHKVYENDKAMAFLDILPISPGHTIIVPKNHVADVENLNDDELCAMAIAIKKIGKAVMEGLGVKGYSVFSGQQRRGQPACSPCPFSFSAQERRRQFGKMAANRLF